MEAANGGHAELCEFLLKRGPDVNHEEGVTALGAACFQGLVAIADLLIKAGAKLESGDATPLMEAARQGHLSMVNMSIEIWFRIVRLI